MTEAEWLTAGSLTKMVAAIPPATSPRRLLLFAVACCRRAANAGERVFRLREWAIRIALDAIEEYADFTPNPKHPRFGFEADRPDIAAAF